MVPKTFIPLFLQQRNNNVYLSMVQSVLQMESFYFSCSYDLTHTMQRLSRTSPDFLQMPLFERVCEPHSCFTFSYTRF